eukprot:TRINITY_DN1195_c0_g1_i1.p1 TRINITY_DN1195_c0_g1~~TRINITY_DN1195_c0_g1_i1.p1  ORF type:complete len:191 (-),score=58.87 TRINITY_DN1195_c0_g1_i1:872-1444(-)
MIDGDSAPTPGKLEQLRAQVSRTYQHWLDRSVIYHTGRWVGFGVLLGVYLLRVYIIQGWFIVTYGLGIFLLNNFIGFLSPQVDPEMDGPGLPTASTDEFRPFTRRLPEFQFWHSSTRGVLTALVMTHFALFDVPVFWPILLVYFVVLFFLTMKRQIKHMIKHRYVPWNWGKAKYRGGDGGTPGSVKMGKS